MFMFMFMLLNEGIQPAYIAALLRQQQLSTNTTAEKPVLLRHGLSGMPWPGPLGVRLGTVESGPPLGVQLTASFSK